MAVIDVREFLERTRAHERVTEPSFQVLTRRHPAGFFAGLHRHDGEEILYVTSGAIRLTLNGERRTYREGDIAFIPAHAEHGFVTLTDSQIDIFQPRDVMTYVTVPHGESNEEEVMVLNGPTPVRRTDHGAFAWQ